MRTQSLRICTVHTSYREATISCTSPFYARAAATIDEQNSAGLNGNRLRNAVRPPRSSIIARATKYAW